MTVVRHAFATVFLLLLQASLARGATNPDAADVQADMQALHKFWLQSISAVGGHYSSQAEATLFEGTIANVCGMSGSQSGPFYCPMNQHVYVDMRFLTAAAKGAGAASRLATDYLLGHEVAHHLQALLGTTASVEQSLARSTPEVARLTLTNMELQADCYNGMWLASIGKQHGMKGDSSLSAVLKAVRSVSGDVQAKLTSGHRLTDPLTYGTDAQRLYWLNRGMMGGHLTDCETFSNNAAGEFPAPQP